jgi:hypothetical protein
MSYRLILIVGLIVGFFGGQSPVRAETSAGAQSEIEYLLLEIGGSGCEFYRNGTWYDAKKAQSHLRSKYESLAARGGLTTAEDFIERVATKSMLSGQPYRVRCGGEVVTSSEWLQRILQTHRTIMQPSRPMSFMSRWPATATAT